MQEETAKVHQMPDQRSVLLVLDCIRLPLSVLTETEAEFEYEFGRISTGIEVVLLVMIYAIFTQ